MFSGNTLPKMIVRDRVYFPLSAIPNQHHPGLHDLFRKSNPDFYQKQRLGLYAYDTPKNIYFHFSDYHSGTFVNEHFTFPIGSIEMVQEYFNMHGIKHVIAYETNDIPATFNCDIKPYPYQEEAISAMQKHRNGLLVARCGAGKTIMALELIARIGQKTLVCVHNRKLMEQWQENIEEIFGEKSGQYGGGKKKVGDNITIGMVQTVVRNVEKIADEFGCVVYDECHHLAANTFFKVANGINSTYRFGITATPNRKDQKGFLFKAALGPVRHKISKKEVEDAGITIPATVNVIKTNFNFPEFRDEESEFFKNYTKLSEKLITDIERVRLIFSYIKKEVEGKHKILMLFNTFNVKRFNPDSAKMIAEAELLQENLNKKEINCQIITGDNYGNLKRVDKSLSNGSVDMYIVTKAQEYTTVNVLQRWESWLTQQGIRCQVADGSSKVKMKDVEERFNNDDLDVLIASTVADEGLDIKILDRVFLCSPCKNNASILEQRVGRIERNVKGKKDAQAFYFLDHLVLGDDIQSIKRLFKNVNVID